MKLTMLGTGNALVTECYNTCFVLSDGNDHFMVDGGGGMTVLHQLKYAGWTGGRWRTIFVTHKHIDHLLGHHLDDADDLPAHAGRYLRGRGDHLRPR